MKRGRDYTGNEPQAKRPKTFMETISTIGQNALTELQNWWNPTANQTLPTEQIIDEGIPIIEDAPAFTDFQPVQLNKPPIIATLEEAPELVDNKVHAVGEIDPDLQEAMALSLMADEEIDKQEPFGRQEKAQKTIATLYPLWQKTSVMHEKHSFGKNKDEIAVRNQQIKTYFEKLEESKTEEEFQNLVIDISWLAVKSAEIYKQCFTPGGPNDITAEYKMFDKFLLDENLVEPFKKKMLIEFDETLLKYKRALKVLNYLKENEYEQFSSLFGKSYSSTYNRVNSALELLKDYKNKVASIGCDFFANFTPIVGYKFKYSQLIQPFQDKMLAVEEMAERFFEANRAFFQLKLKNMLEPQLLANIIGLAVNEDSKIVQFSLNHFEKMQKSMQDVETARKTNTPSGP